MVKEPKAVRVESEHEIWADDILDEFKIKGNFTQYGWDKKRNMLRLIVEKEGKYYTHEVPLEEIAKRWGFPKGEITGVWPCSGLRMPSKKFPYLVKVEYCIGFTVKEKAVGKLEKVI
jgi:hypothetical protein